MTRALLLCLFYMGFIVCSFSQNRKNISIDTSEPIFLKDNIIVYKGKNIKLSSQSLLVDGNLSDEFVKDRPYVFNSFQKAAEHFIDGTQESPMNVYIAPYVYWIDNPDDPEIRIGKDGREPFGIIVKCNNLHLIGLNSNPKNVVLASARGQTQGAIGNFTMFDFWGDGLMVKNMTMGNFCNVDLDYPLDSTLSRSKRMSAITQAHVGYCHGDRIVAENVRFISRLNMNPLTGTKRILYNNCHMESTDDALNGTGVYLNCTLDFYGQRPFWRSDMSGAIFMNCDFFIKHENDRSFFCKSVGPLSIVDCRYHVTKPLYLGWTNTPTEWLRCYQYNVKVNSQPYIIGADKPYNTICMDGTKLVDAYRFEINDSVIYNTYNLLRGEDSWDPLNVRKYVEEYSKGQGRDCSNMGTCLSLTPLEANLQTGKSPLTIKAEVRRHVGYLLNNETVRWKVQKGFEKYVSLSNTEGDSCTINATNHDDDTKSFSIIAYTDRGLECATYITVYPDFVDPPKFTLLPSMRIAAAQAALSYSLDLKGRKDESLITWYRCKDKNGGDKLPVLLSRQNKPEQSYKLTKADVGYYIFASIKPKHLRSLPGDESLVCSKSKISLKDVDTLDTYETDFHNFPSNNQLVVKEGFWTVSGFKPEDTSEYDWKVDNANNYWEYGEGINGAKGLGLLQVQKGARMLYTPVNREYNDMSVLLRVDAAKTAGQGFGSATGQYMDLFIKYDTKCRTGYGLRIIRTTKYSHAVDFILMRYDNGISKAISEPVSAICYRTGTTINLKVEGNKLTAHVETETILPEVEDKNLKKSVDLSCQIVPNKYGGLGIQHTGSCGEGATMLHYLKVDWK